MLISLSHLNTLVEPGTLTADEAERLLTFIGFPIESKTVHPSGDVLLDVEVTSNRGDCLCHTGVAREVAAASGRRYLNPVTTSVPALAAVQANIATSPTITLENRVPDACPLFTLRVIRGVKVGPSPAWLVERLAAVGQRSINNVVDITNFVQSALGNPSHVFDLAKIRPAPRQPASARALIVRSAEKGERLTLLDGKTVELRPGEIVVADGVGPLSLAGVMGGSESGVSTTTTDVVLEVATWAPGLVRKAARRLQLRTDASHRFERFVDARTLDAASRRAAELIMQVAGGTLEGAALAAGKPIPASPTITFRPQRCRLVLGAGFTDEQIRTALGAQGVALANAGAESWFCTPPDHRPDLKREIDLVEEVARTIGLEKIPVHDKVAVRVAPPQQSEVAARELCRVLTGLGFFETVTVSFVSNKQAKMFAPREWSLLGVSDDRRADDGILRPSVIPSLLACRRANQHAKSAPDGSIRLFELAPVFAQVPEGTPGRSPAGHAEHATLALILDAPARNSAPGIDSPHARRQAALRQTRAVIDSLVSAMMGRHVSAEITPTKLPFDGLDAEASATISVNGAQIGHMGLVSTPALALFELENPIAAAVLNVPMLLSAYPPRELVSALPAFPATERDLSLVVDEALTWREIDRCITHTQPAGMQSLHFVGTYRGKPLDEGKKSVTLRMVFRDPARTLRDEEVNAEVDRLVAAAGSHLRATVRV